MVRAGDCAGAGRPHDAYRLRSLSGAPTGMVVIEIIGGPLSEELGWRGFALDRLQDRWSPLVSSLFLATFWAVWHLPRFSMSDTTQYA
jgi:membrane protease YdiL (CAAX protease family)